MLQTYEAVLRSNQIEWDAEAPQPTPAGQPLRVHITILGPSSVPPSGESGKRMALELEKIAALGSMSTIADPIEWQREQRQDRSLPGREE